MCAIMGLAKKQELSRRRSELDYIIKFAEFAKNEILYRNCTLDKIICKGKNIGSFFLELASCEETRFLDKYEQTKKKYGKITALKDEDFRCLDLMFELLGKTDGKDQINFLDNIIHELKDLRDEASSEHEKHGGLYVKMGIAVGCFAVMICL